MPKVPHPIPYQGSKRKLAGQILPYIKLFEVDTLYEPFSGSAAATLAAAAQGLAGKYHINDSLGPPASLWQQIIADPDTVAREYERIWDGQTEAGPDYYARIRAEFNGDQDVVKLLYLLARCMKAAVRFNSRGEFNQSADKRRLGTRPETMKKELVGASSLLKGKTAATGLDFREALRNVSDRDFVYLDPPWQGTSQQRDTRYHQVLNLDALVSELRRLNRLQVPYVLSFDGTCGDRAYGADLPEELGLERTGINAGRSSQATLAGRNEVTVESLYLSPRVVQALKALGFSAVD